MAQRWLSPRVLGLDIEKSFLNYAEISCQKGTISLRRGGALALEQVAGSEEALKEALSRIDLHNVKIASAISSSEISVKSFRFPNLSRKQLQKAIRMEAEAAALSTRSLDEMAIDLIFCPL